MGLVVDLVRIESTDPRPFGKSWLIKFVQTRKSYFCFFSTSQGLHSAPSGVLRAGLALVGLPDLNCLKFNSMMKYHGHVHSRWTRRWITATWRRLIDVIRWAMMTTPHDFGDPPLTDTSPFKPPTECPAICILEWWSVHLRPCGFCWRPS